MARRATVPSLEVVALQNEVVVGGSRDGSLRHAITETGLGLRKFEHLLDGGGGVIVRASEEPTEAHIYRVPLDPADGAPTRLTTEPGLHAVESTRSGPRFVIASSTLAGELGYRVHDGQKPTRHELLAVVEDPGIVPNIEITSVGRDPEFRAVLIRPRDFEKGKRYPVIDHVYGGPTSVMVKADRRAYLLDQWIADHGYVVVAIDGRGTPNRGRDWQRSVKNDLIRVPLNASTLAEKSRSSGTP